MSRRFVNMMVSRSIGRGRGRLGYSLHRIDPWRCFYPTRGAGRAEALEELAANNNKKTWMEDARLPRSAISFFHPCPPDDIGDIAFASLGCSSNDIISTDHDGNTLLYDAASGAVRAMPAPHAPKDCSTISLSVGDTLYLLNHYPAGPQEDYHPFEALTPCRRSFKEGWCWHSLPPPPFPISLDNGYHSDDSDSNNVKVDPEEDCHHLLNNKDDALLFPPCYFIEAYSVVGDSQIWISTRSGGTFSFDTTTSVWTQLGDWALPFYGHVHYAPELGLWFGFTSSGNMQRLAAADLGAASHASPPVLHEELVWDEIVPPLQDRWVPMMDYLLPLGAGKFCVARVFDMAEEGWRRDKDRNNYDTVETFAVFTGVELQRDTAGGSLRMIRHKSRRYSFGHMTISFIL